MIENFLVKLYDCFWFLKMGNYLTDGKRQVLEYVAIDPMGKNVTYEVLCPADAYICMNEQDEYLCELNDSEFSRIIFLAIQDANYDVFVYKISEYIKADELEKIKRKRL